MLAWNAVATVSKSNNLHSICQLWMHWQPTWQVPAVGHTTAWCAEQTALCQSSSPCHSCVVDWKVGIAVNIEGSRAGIPI